MAALARGLDRRLRRALDSVPVVILEGGRAVGKTWLAAEMVETKALRERVDLQSLAERQRASLDPEQFVLTLGASAAIDEAQLVPELAVAVKRLVDLPGSAHRFLLTGSARIGRGALGGADPLAGRAVRLRLRPFTQGELAGEPVDRTSAFFNSSFVPGASYPQTSGDALWRRLVTGGTAGLVIRSGERIAQKQSYLESVIHLGIGESRLDRARILEVFRALAAHSSGRLNLSQQAGKLQVTRQTLEKYVRLLEDTFLLERLHGYRPDPLARLRTMPKIIASDVGLAAWAMGLEGAQRDRRQSAIGGLVETLVANELLAQAEWSDGGVELYYWRDGAGNEVDFVLTDRTGSVIPIEVKSSSVLRGEMANGVRAFRRAFPQCGAGYVLYGGDSVVDIGDGVMAVPISVLWTQAKESVTVSPNPASTGPALFVSYVHADDEAEGGRISQLARDLGDRFEFLTGEALDVFIDKDIRWGEEWRGRLSTELARATVFVAIVTPRFLRSEACRQEVFEFTSVADAQGEQRRFCSLLYVAPDDLDREDPVERLIADHQYVDWQERRYEDRGSGPYRRALDLLVRSIAEQAPQPASAVAKDSEAQEDLVDLLERLAEVQVLESDVERLGEALTAAMGAFERGGAELADASEPGQMRAALRRTAVAVDPEIAPLREASDQVRERTVSLSKAVEGLIAGGFVDELDGLVTELPTDLGIDVGEMAEARQMLKMLRGFSKDLRPFVDAVADAIQLMEDLVQLPSSWRRSVDVARNRLRDQA